MIDQTILRISVAEYIMLNILFYGAMFLLAVYVTAGVMAGLKWLKERFRK